MFVGAVHAALLEQHRKFSIAHLDVRMGNISISPRTANPVAKLTDLDRSAPATQLVHVRLCCRHLPLCDVPGAQCQVDTQPPGLVAVGDYGLCGTKG